MIPRWTLLVLLIGCTSIHHEAAAPRVQSFAPTDLGRLNWGSRSAAELRALAAAGETDDLSRQLRNVLRKATEALQRTADLPTVAHIEREHVLSTDPRFRASQPALQGVETILHWAVCARVATGALAQDCGHAATKNILKWVGTYQSEGNAVNDQNLLPLFLAVDLLHASFTSQDATQVDAWLKSLALRGDARWKKIPSQAATQFNNHQTWRLTLRALAGQVTDDETLNAASLKLLQNHASANLIPPTGWQPDAGCANNRDEAHYGSYDFRQRDALLYHVYNLRAWAWLALFAPDFVADRAAVLNAAQFLEPYFVGRKSHAEFVCSKILFDLERKQAGMSEYQNFAWDPAKGRPVLRLLLPVFPEIKEWAATAATTDSEAYPPWIKLIAALRTK